MDGSDRARESLVMLNYERLYEFRFRGVNKDARLATWRVISADVYVRMGRPNVMLDPAAGSGEFITTVPSAERWAIDRVQYFKDDVANVKFVLSDIFDAELPEEYFDGIFVSNFLEHLSNPDAIGTLLEKLRHSLRPEGRLAIMGPNFKYCAAQYFDCADHILPLSHVAVEEHLYAAGFLTSVTVPRYLPYSFRSSLPPHPSLVRKYLRIPLAQRILGKQFLLIAQKV
jgi:SAM-dependent methyltransferase